MFLGKQYTVKYAGIMRHDLEMDDWKGIIFTPKYAYFSLFAGKGRETNTGQNIQIPGTIYYKEFMLHFK